MRQRAKGSHRWHSARSCSQEQRYRWRWRVRKRSTAATASSGVGSPPRSLRLPHHLHPFLPCSPCCCACGSGMSRAAGATGDGAHRQHSRTDLGVPAKPTTGGPDSSLRCASHTPAPHRWQTATAARKAHPVSTRQREQFIRCVPPLPLSSSLLERRCKLRLPRRLLASCVPAQNDQAESLGSRKSPADASQQGGLSGRGSPPSAPFPSFRPVCAACAVRFQT